MHNCLARHVTAVHTNVKAFDTFIGSEDAEPQLIEKYVDGPTLWVIEIKVCR